MNNQIKINLHDVDPIVGLEAVVEVIKQGKISQGRTRKLYCRISVFKNEDKDLIVTTNDTAYIDSFSVHYAKK